MRNPILNDLLAAGRGDAIALSAPAAVELSYDGLRQQVVQTGLALNRIGIGAGDRVAMMLPNGPAMATAFLSVASAAAAAPLNPSYRADELEFFLSDLGAKALIVSSDSDSPAIEIAVRLGVAVLKLQAMPELGAGRFGLNTARVDMGPEAGPRAATADDIALVLHTSGTTSRPKIVPLSQRNLCASARNIRESLELTESDRGLNVMPLFHIHGLIAAVLAPLSAGGSVYCTPGFNALKFFDWVDTARANWYTAVPTMHQAILTRASQNAGTIAEHPMRFIRSSSSSLPPQVLGRLEKTFGCPVIEAYGMTEAAHQMASNPLPPGIRKPGTVGRGAGPEIAIMSEGGFAAVGVPGEIVIRGDNVTSGYEKNPAANTEAFIEGWFRTGDQGVQDLDGYISITGRLKEIINRGGEKISPREIDEVLLDHPAVQQVVTFGIPHDKLGEEVGAAIVLHEGTQVSKRALRDFVSARVADYKVPRKVMFLDEIPKGATGKMQRIGLAKKLGLVKD